MNDIDTQITSWAKNAFGSDFTFRPHQFETIKNILETHLSFGEKTQVAQCPCGSGKSIIAFIVAGVLADYYNQKSYILASDTALFDQYEAEIKRFNLPFGYLKGKDNYRCNRNGKSIQFSECRSDIMSLLRDEKTATWPCEGNCKYICSFKRAARSKVTVMTYQLYLAAMDCQSMLGEHFKKRHFIICDEAHNLPGIVQEFASPTFSVGEEYEDFLLIYKHAEKEDNKHSLSHPSIFKELQQVSETIFETKDADDVIKLLNFYKQYLEPYFDYATKLSEKHSKELDDKTLKSLNKVLYTSRKFGSCNYTNKDLIAHCVQKDVSTSFKYARESSLVKVFFHDRTNSQLLMSATIGNIDIYKSVIDQPKVNYIETPHIFNYGSSPIFYQSINRMSFREKKDSIGPMIKQIEEICKSNEKVKGVIQTGSFEFSKELYNRASPELRHRLINYENAKDKKEALELLKSSFNKILIGPSLLEGLDLFDDLCRFIIVMKVPYASLGDSLVLKKKEIYPGWYNADVCNKLEQGVNRHVRNDRDWGVTYILDGCFADLKNYSQIYMSENFKSRLCKL